MHSTDALVNHRAYSNSLLLRPIDVFSFLLERWIGLFLQSSRHRDWPKRLVIACAPSMHVLYQNSRSLHSTWWRHQMETVSVLLALGAGNSPVTGEFPSQRPVTRSLDVFFDLRLTKRLSKPSRGWWFETPMRSLWRHYSDQHFLP